MGLTLSRKRGRKLVLTAVEDDKVVKYIMAMAKYGHPISITELKIEVAEATQMRETPLQGWDSWGGLGPLVMETPPRNFALHVAKTRLWEGYRLMSRECFDVL
jgi:hypothetical protein